MKITPLQAEVLENLHRIVMVRGEKQTRYSLDGRDCRGQIVGLAAQGAVRWDGHGRPARVAISGNIAIWRRAKTDSGDPS